MTDLKKTLNRIRDKIKKGESIFISLPGGGRFKMEKPVPFLVLYRIPPNGKDDFTSKLGKTESAYLYAADLPDGDLPFLIKEISNLLADEFKGFLLLEVWLTEKESNNAFNVHVSQKSGKEVAEKLTAELGRILLEDVVMNVELNKTKSIATPPYYQPIFDNNEANKSGITLIGLEIAPFYMNQATGKAYPVILRELRAQFSRAIKKGFFEFIRFHTSYSASSFQMLGTTSLEKRVFEIDDKLGHLSNLFDFLLLVTPVNTDDAWEEFVKSNYRKKPVFHYRPLPIDPELIKREIYNLPIEDIDDPTLAFLYRDKRKEIDRMLNMMAEREKGDFMHSSLQVFGPIDDKLLDIAKAILVATHEDVEDSKREKISANEFAKMAEEELKWLKLQYPKVSTAVRVRDDIHGILVSRGTLNINKNFSVSRERAFSLLQHEIGTHVVTYYNGKAQPLKLFYVGVPGYEELQEGLAVFSEFLTGGLTVDRMRTLAARVVIVDQLISGSSFIESFSLLVDKHGFSEKAAYLLTTRVYRGGGLTKDGVYLKGLLNIIEYIKKGKSLEALLIGKIRQDYLPVVRELIHRQILIKPVLKPRYLEEKYFERLNLIKNGGSIFNMIHG